MFESIHAMPFVNRAKGLLESCLLTDGIADEIQTPVGYKIRCQIVLFSISRKLTLQVKYSEGVFYLLGLVMSGVKAIIFALKSRVYNS